MIKEQRTKTLAFALALVIASYLLGVQVSRYTGNKAYRISTNKMHRMNQALYYDNLKKITLDLEARNSEQAICKAANEAFRIFESLQECVGDADCRVDINWSGPMIDNSEISTGPPLPDLIKLKESCAVSLK
jgi:hypothetical protein